MSELGPSSLSASLVPCKLSSSCRGHLPQIGKADMEPPFLGSQQTGSQRTACKVSKCELHNQMNEYSKVSWSDHIRSRATFPLPVTVRRLGTSFLSGWSHFVKAEKKNLPKYQRQNSPFKQTVRWSSRPRGEGCVTTSAATLLMVHKVPFTKKPKREGSPRDNHRGYSGVWVLGKGSAHVYTLQGTSPMVKRRSRVPELAVANSELARSCLACLPPPQLCSLSLRPKCVSPGGCVEYSTEALHQMCCFMKTHNCASLIPKCPGPALQKVLCSPLTSLPCRFLTQALVSKITVSQLTPLACHSNLVSYHLYSNVKSIISVSPHPNPLRLIPSYCTHVIHEETGFSTKLVSGRSRIQTWAVWLLGSYT